MRGDPTCTRCERPFAPQGIVPHLRACLRGEGGFLAAVTSFEGFDMREFHVQVRGATTIGGLRHAVSEALGREIGPLQAEGGPLDDKTSTADVLARGVELEAPPGVRLRVVLECAGEDRLAATDRPAIKRMEPRGAVRLRIDLRHVRPKVWRRITIPATATFQDLHAVIQAAMPWQGSHLHQFDAYNMRIGDPATDWGMDPILDQAATRLCDLLAPGVRLVYWYDFGDDWFHDIHVEAQEDTEAPDLLDGAGAAPPEDCGGPFGFEELRAALADPDHEDHDEMVEWAGELPGFDRDKAAARVREALRSGWVRA